MGGKGSGRRPKYNAEVHATIVRHLELGAFRKHAAEAAGVGIDAFNRWMQLGAAGDETYEQFAIDCERAIAEDAVRNQRIISAAAISQHKGDWKAAAWNLEKKHPKLYGTLAQSNDISELRKQGKIAEAEKVHSPWKRPEAN